MPPTSPPMRRSGEKESRARRRSPSTYEPDSKRRRADSYSPGPPRRRNYPNNSRERDNYQSSRRGDSHYPNKRASYQSPRGGYNRGSSRRYENNNYAPPPQNGLNGSHQVEHGRGPAAMHQPMTGNSGRSRRLYVGNVPTHVGLTDVALTQFFSALYIAGFRPNKPGEPLPVVSFWLHTDGKFGFMELRGEQETVNMMQFNGTFLHNRPLRVNRPSDYRPEHHPDSMNLLPQTINIPAVMELCEKLGAIVAAPAPLAAIAASQPSRSVSSPIRPNSTAGPPPLESEKKKAEPMLVKPEKVEVPISTKANHVEEKPNVRPDSGTTRPRKREPNPAPLVISLKNLVTDEDLEGTADEFEEIVSDVRDECSKYGKVEEVNIPRDGIWKGNAFVQFTEPNGAQKAIEALTKRIFDGKQVIAIGVEECSTATQAASRKTQ